MGKLNFVLDVDGVLSTGQFLYSNDGKTHKIFGPHDADGLKFIKDDINISFISGDKRGFPISEKRVHDMGFKIALVTEQDRYNYIKETFGFEDLIYMGDGIFDVDVLRECKFGIVPAGARREATLVADHVTPSRAGEGAVCDACLEIGHEFLNKTIGTQE